MSNQNYYQILQIDPSAEQEVIEAAYRRLARKYHPDVNASNEAAGRMTRLNEAYEALRDPQRRTIYDLELKLSEASARESELARWREALEYERQQRQAAAQKQAREMDSLRVALEQERLRRATAEAQKAAAESRLRESAMPRPQPAYSPPPPPPRPVTPEPSAGHRSPKPASASEARSRALPLSLLLLTIPALLLFTVLFNWGGNFVRSRVGASAPEQQAASGGAAAIGAATGASNETPAALAIAAQLTPTRTPTRTPRPSMTPRPTRTPRPSATPTTTNTPGPSPTPTETATPVPTATPHPAVSAVYEGEHFSLQVIGPTRRFEALIGETAQVEADGIYLVVPVRLKNVSLIDRYTHYMPDVCIRFASTYGDCEHNATYAELAYYDSIGRFWDHNPKVSPGRSVTTWLVFDVPETLSDPVMRVYFDGAWTSDPIADIPLLVIEIQ